MEAVATAAAAAVAVAAAGVLWASEKESVGTVAWLLNAALRGPLWGLLLALLLLLLLFSEE